MSETFPGASRMPLCIASFSSICTATALDVCIIQCNLHFDCTYEAQHRAVFALSSVGASWRVDSAFPLRVVTVKWGRLK